MYDLEIFYLNPPKDDVEKAKRETEKRKANFKLGKYLTHKRIKDIIENEGQK